MGEILVAHDLCKTYGTKETQINALKNVNLSVNKGTFLAINGPSGGGKSTLLNLIGGLDYATSGKIIIDGNDISKLNEEELTVFRRKEIGFVFQNYNLVPVLTAFENIILPVQLDNKQFDENYLNLIIRLLHIEEKKNCFPNELSGGQQQRVAIARALATKPKIILADEPTGNLDSQNAEEVVELLKETSRKLNQTIIMITHNEVLAKKCDQIYLMKDGVLKKTDRGEAD